MGKSRQSARQGAQREQAEAPRQGGIARFEAWVTRHTLWWIVGSMGLYVLLAVLNFDAKVSIGGDDSWYVMAADDFWHGVEFPGWHGALYPMLLAPLVGGLGLGIPFLKLLSILAVALAIWLFGRAFAGRVRPVVWLCALLLWSVGHTWVVLGSTTYSEPLFMLLEMALLFVFLRVQDGEGRPFARSGWRGYALLGLLSFLLALTRNVGWGAVLALVFFLVAVRRDWRAGLGYAAWVAIFQLPFSLYKRVAWAESGVSFGGQLQKVLQVDFYNASEGLETPWGMCRRFIANAYQYLGYHSLRFAGFDLSPSWIVTLGLIGLCVYTLIWAWRRDRVVALLGVYLGVMLGVTFLTQQVAWGQPRLVVVYFPLLLLFLFGWLASPRTGLRQVTGIFVLVFTGLGLLASIKKDVQELSSERLAANLRGDEFYGLTPDWDSYLRTARWVGENLPDSAVVLARKPNNARVYAGRPFFPMFKLPTTDPDTAHRFLDSNRIEYVMAGRLRKSPQRRSEEFINAVHVLLSLALYDQPDLLEEVHREGRSEPTVLYRLHREAGSGTQEEIRRRLEAGVQVAPYNYEVLHKLAVACLHDREPERALRYASQAIRAFEAVQGQGSYPLYEVKGMAEFALGEADKAATLFAYCTRQFPDNPHAWYNLGVCLRKLGETQRAEEAFSKAAALGEKE